MKRVVLFIIVPACLLLVYAGCESDGTSAETENDGFVTSDPYPYMDAASDIPLDYSGSEAREDAEPDLASGPDAAEDACSDPVPDLPAADTPVEVAYPDVPADTGPPDTAIDTGPPDAPVDTGPPDAPVDTGPPDVPVDTGPPDLPADTGLPDALPDSSTEDAPEPPVDDVCGLELTEPQVLFLSADDSNSQASPAIARALIRNDKLVPDWIVRTYEFLNYYTFSYDRPEPGHVLAAGAMAQLPDDDVRFNLQIGVQSHEQTLEETRSMNITLILDTSGSMRGTPINLLKEACRQIAGILREGDIVSLAEWDTFRTRRLDGHAVSGPDDIELLSAIRGLTADGGTDLHAGLVEGYAMAHENFDTEKLNRVVLISDGMANVGITDKELIALHAHDAEMEGIYLVGVGVGEGYNDTLMDAVTEAGKGAYVFIDSAVEAEYIFRDRFVQTFDMAVMRVQVELVLPPVLRMEVFHGEEMSGDPKEVEPQHLAPNDAMIFHQTLKRCGLPSRYDRVLVTAHYVDRDTRERKSDSFEFSLPYLFSNEDGRLTKGDAIVAYAEGLKQVYKLIKASDAGAATELCSAVRDEVHNAALELDDSELFAIVGLLNTYCATLGFRDDTTWH